MEEIIRCHIEKLSESLPPSHKKETEVRNKINEIIDFLTRYEFKCNMDEDY